MKAQVRPTPLGLFYFTILILISIVAVNTMNNLFYLFLSGLLAIAGVSGFFSRWNLHGLRIELLLPEEIYARQKTPLQVALYNPRRRLPAFLVRLRLGEVQALVPEIPPGKSRTATLAFTPPQRGFFPLPPLLLSSTFPLGLFVRQVPVPLNKQLLVFPPIHPVGELDPSGLNRSSGEDSMDQVGTGGDFRGVRDYAEGDPIRLIHWKVSARREVPVVKEFHSEAVRSVVLTLEDTRHRDPDRVAEDLASLAVALYRRGLAVGLSLPGAEIPPAPGKAGLLRVLRTLALWSPIGTTFAKTEGEKKMP